MEKLYTKIKNREIVEEIMAQKKKVMATVMEQKELAPGIFDMWLKTELASDAKCGQFIGVYPEDKSNLLPRPISICEVNKEEGMQNCISCSRRRNRRILSLHSRKRSTNLRCFG